MRCRIKTIGLMVVVAVTCGLCLRAGRSPSWSDLTESAAQTCFGGTTCVVPGTQNCPWLYAQCEYRYGPSCEYKGDYYECTAAKGDDIEYPYPEEAKEEFNPGKDDTSYDFDYECGIRYYCNDTCWLNPNTERYECTSGLQDRVLSVVKSWPSGSSCTSNEE